MKKLVISAMALGLFLSAPAAMAAHNDHNGGQGHGAKQGHAEKQQERARPAQPAAQQARHAQPAARHAQPAAYRGRQAQPAVQQARRVQPAAYRAEQNRGARRSQAVHERNSIRSANRARAGAILATRRSNAATQNANRATARANYATYNANVRSAQRYHWNNYRRPTGWYAHRWTYGERLPTAYYSDNYWIADFISFGLMAPPSGLVWVREDNDALLIDRYSGQIVRVEYDVFY